MFGGAIYKLFTGRSPKWPKLRDRWLEDNPHCEVCRTTSDCEAHHIIPFQLDPKRELDTTNLMTLCREHHFLFGHLLNWSSWNDNVVNDALDWRDKIRFRPRKPE